MRLVLTLLVLPLVLLAAVAGHVASELVARTPPREVELFANPHSRTALLLLLCFFAFAALVVAGAASADEARRSLSPRLFAVLPPVIFACGEVAEAVVAHASLGHMLFSSEFAAGLFAQAPFAAVAYLAARLLRRIGSAFWRVIFCDRGTRPAILVALSAPRSAEDDRRPRQFTVGCVRGRAPPLVGVSLT